jgi:hypothetical protein
MRLWRARVERGFEIALGLIVAFCAIISIGGAALAIIDLAVGQSQTPGTAFIVGVASSLLAWFCTLIGWRLLTGRERPGGGLLHPGILYGFGYLAAGAAVARATIFGPEHVRLEQENAARMLDEIRDRHLKGRDQ